MNTPSCREHPSHHLVAVYGTLLSGLAPRAGRPQPGADDWHLVADATLPGTLVDTGYGYPGLLLTATRNIDVELWCASTDALAVWDRWEDYRPAAPEDGEYVRLDVGQLLDPAAFTPVWAYVYNWPVDGMAEIFDSWRDRHDRGQQTSRRVADCRTSRPRESG